MSAYLRSQVEELRNGGAADEYVHDYVRLFAETGLDLRDMPDGMDVDEFLDAYEDGDFDAMMDFM